MQIALMAKREMGEDGGGRREEKRKRTKLDLHFLLEKYVMGSGKRMMMMCVYDSFVCLSAFIYFYSHYSLSLPLSPFRLESLLFQMQPFWITIKKPIYTHTHAWCCCWLTVLILTITTSGIRSVDPSTFLDLVICISADPLVHRASVHLLGRFGSCFRLLAARVCALIIKPPTAFAQFEFLVLKLMILFIPKITRTNCTLCFIENKRCDYFIDGDFHFLSAQINPHMWGSLGILSFTNMFCSSSSRALIVDRWRERTLWGY